MNRLFAALALTLGLAACTPADIDRFITSTQPTIEVLSNAQLKALRDCESTDNYEATSKSGTYRGAYQFDQRTWNDVASRHFPWLQDLDPATVEFFWQDAMTRALYSERGAQPWPVCGRRL